MSLISIILASLFMAGTPAEQLGETRVTEIRKSYDSKQYEDFLSQMDVSYKAADLSNLIEMREHGVPADFQEKWEEKFSSMEKERNAQLMLAIPDTEDSLFAQKARSLAADVTTDAQDKALSRLHALIAKAPKTGVNDDENALIAIDLEYEYKLSLAQNEQQELALRMEKMDKMVEASKSFKDHSLKTAVGLAASNLDQRLSRNLDGIDLNALIRNKVQPVTDTEEQALAIIAIYQMHFNALMQELAEANQPV
jgi:hypothetical protein